MFVGTPQYPCAPVPADVPLPPSRAAERDAEEMRRVELLRDIQVELQRRGLFQGEVDGAPARARRRRSATLRPSSAGRHWRGQRCVARRAADQPCQHRCGRTGRPPTRDQIANLLKASPDRFERPATVAAVQRALSRLGYGPLKDDGQFGPGTRAALDRFERDRKLPSRAENPNRVLRELSQASGIAID